MKRLLKWLANALGYEVRSLKPTPAQRRQARMQELGINLVLDVGANAGQYALDLRKSGYKGKIWSYEPLQAAFASLEKAAAVDPNWRTVHCACGARGGITAINVAKNSVSSSVLPMLAAHLANAPDSVYISQEAVPVWTLDDDVQSRLVENDRVWLKCDTQGFEDQVIQGAVHVLHSVRAIECELSLVPLYHGGLLMADMLNLFSSYGFRLIDIAPGFTGPVTGQQLQVDGTFVRL